MGKELGATVEIHLIEFPVNKRRFRKKFNKTQKGKKSNIEENDSDLDKKIGKVLREMSKRGNNVRLEFNDKEDGRERIFYPKIHEDNKQK